MLKKALALGRIVAIILCAWSAPAAAQSQANPFALSRASIRRAAGSVRPQSSTPPEESRWPRVLSLRHGQKVIITIDGRALDLHATVVTADLDSLTVEGPGGAREQLPRTAIERIVVDGKTDEWKIGTGLAIGGIAAFVIGAAARPPEAGPTIGVPIGWALVGVGGLTVLDANRKGGVIYLRPSPASSPSP